MNEYSLHTYTFQNTTWTDFSFLLLEVAHLEALSQDLFPHTNAYDGLPFLS